MLGSPGGKNADKKKAKEEAKKAKEDEKRKREEDQRLAILLSRVSNDSFGLFVSVQLSFFPISIFSVRLTFLLCFR